ncbi:hypothetical protein ACNPQM_26020 [Streptomyces sp. NPDC056231]|uniref:hypothetical protein n=1 Tax=unclassified Streptomyces TaxID=2593676 RepID=UPI0034081076
MVDVKLAVELALGRRWWAPAVSLISVGLDRTILNVAPPSLDGSFAAMCAICVIGALNNGVAGAF